MSDFSAKARKAKAESDIRVSPAEKEPIGAASSACGYLLRSVTFNHT
jgi:hypothetical protein